MPHWLFKSDPECYGYDDLERDGQTLWDGVTNAQARIHLRAVKPGDLIWCYHTGDEKSIVGVMKAVGAPQPDPNDDDPKSVAVTVKSVRRLKNPVTLAQVKSEPRLASWELVTNSRLSVMPVTPEQWKKIEEMSKAAQQV